MQNYIFQITFPVPGWSAWWPICHMAGGILRSMVSSMCQICSNICWIVTKVTHYRTKAFLIICKIHIFTGVPFYDIKLLNAFNEMRSSHSLVTEKSIKMLSSVHGFSVLIVANSFIVKNIDLLLSRLFLSELSFYIYFFTDTIIVTLDLENLMLENIQS